MTFKFSLAQKPFLILSALILLSGFAFNGAVVAEDQREMIIAIKTDAVRIEQLDISDLATGDVETIYSDDGKTIDVMKTAEGVEIFIDGEKLDIPALGIHSTHDDGHEAKHIIMKLHCDSEADEYCAADEQWTIIGDDDVDSSDAIRHRIIIKKQVHSEDEI